MEPKFKTFYKGQLIDCDVDTSTGLVIAGSPIGYFKGNIGKGGLPILEIFQSTGKVVKNGLVYRGHLIKINLLQMIAKVVWNQKKAGFYLKIDDIDNTEYLFEDNYFESTKCEIVGHITGGAF